LVIVTKVPLVISPHFDDAVLSCGHWLGAHPGAIVATVCSGDPGPSVPASEGWDARAGFLTGSDATNARRAEDLAALTVLRGEQRLLGYLDAPYRHGEPLDEVGLEDAVVALLDELQPGYCLVPLGLLHPDHVSTGRAARAALRKRPNCAAIAYRELPYAFLPDHPSLEADGLAALQTEGMRTRELSVTAPLGNDAKQVAVHCYGTQLRLLGDQLWQKTLELGSERFWRLHSRDGS
jgi:LmbE family N-acetylglucosaminyl deacetylase